MTWLAVALGGALGSMARHGVNHLVAGRFVSPYPIGITVVNVSGCFAIGLLAGLLATDRVGMRMEWREFVFVGVLGGYTTFSTFGLDTLILLRGGAMALAFANIAAQVLGGLAAVWIGFTLASR